MRAEALVLILVAACGRYGFSEPTDAGAGADGAEDAFAKPDAPIVIDAAMVFDAAIGTGSYTVADTAAPYQAPAGASVVPGFQAGADDNSYVIALPFTFTFYGLPYTAVTVSVNGYLMFGTPPAGADDYTNDCPIDGTSPDAMIAVFWDDLFASAVTPPLGTIVYAIDGAMPARRLTVEWRDLDAWYPAGTGGNFFSQGVRVTQQVVLHESGQIEMHYGPRTPPTSPNKDCGPDRHRGCSATVGLEAAGGLSARAVQCGTSDGPGAGYLPIDEGRLITFTPG